MRDQEKTGLKKKGKRERLMVADGQVEIKLT